MPCNIVEHVITYPSTSAKSVRLVGNFGTWSGWVDMKKEKGGNDDVDFYKSKLYLKEGSTIKYRFFVNGKHWGFDPSTTSTVDDDGFTINVAHVSSDCRRSLENNGGAEVYVN